MTGTSRLATIALGMLAGVCLGETARAQSAPPPYVAETQWWNLRRPGAVNFPDQQAFGTGRLLFLRAQGAQRQAELAALHFLAVRGRFRLVLGHAAQRGDERLLSAIAPHVQLDLLAGGGHGDGRSQVTR